MSEGFTPGPWKYGLDDIDAVWAPNAVLPGNVICAPPFQDESFNQWPANAKLIAAAPDLFDALEAMLDKFAPPNAIGNQWDADKVAAHQFASTIIARARGQS